MFLNANLVKNAELINHTVKKNDKQKYQFINSSDLFLTLFQTVLLHEILVRTPTNKRVVKGEGVGIEGGGGGQMF